MSTALSDEPIDIPMSVRRTESLDAFGISQLVTEETHKVFGQVHVSHIIEKANLGVTLVDETNVITGYAAFYDHPNWLNEENVDWRDWLGVNFEEKRCDSMNTLFLHYFVGKKEFSEGIIKELFRTVFHAVPLLEFIVLVVPPDVEIGTALSNVFFQLEDTTEYNTPYEAYKCLRHHYCPVLHVREARIEDHDDLMPIFDKYNTHLKELYGEFFLAELIDAQDERNKCIVADVDGTAVGFVSLTLEMKTDVLKDNFSLEVFNYFLKKMNRKIAVSRKPDDSNPPPSLGEEKTEEVESTNKDTLAPVLPSQPEKRLSGSRKAPPLQKSPRQRSPRSRSPKLSSSHLDKEKSDEASAEEVEYITETFSVESVFCIQLFCIDDKYEARSCDFLPAMFDLFPDKDFVVITVPHNVPEFPLLQSFQRVSPKPESTLGHELYLFHKYGLYKSFNVRPCAKGDVKQIRSLTETIKGHQDIMRDVEQHNNYRRDADGIQIHAFVAEVVGQVVGVCVCRDEADTMYIRSHYNIEDFLYFCLHDAREHAHLYHFVLNPIFQHYSKYFLKEVFHLANKSSLYYPIYPESAEPSGKPHSLVTCLSDLVPVSVRRQIVYPLETLEQNIPTQDVIKEEPPYALYHINRKLTFEPKIVVNLRIVVVGASTVGLSAIQTFLFCPHLCFNNLTLVSDEEVFQTSVSDELCDSFLPQSMDYNKKQHDFYSLPTWLNVIRGNMTRIDRKNKILHVNGDQQVPYDQLLLCTGQQFHTVVPTGANVRELLTTSEALQEKLPQVHQGFTPENVFVLNSPSDCQKIKHWIENSFSTDKVIVYGSTLEAYVCINGLITNAVHPSAIHHVLPPSNPPSCFDFPHVANVMKKEIEKLGVVSHHGYTLARWNDGEEDEQLKVATFTSDTKPLTLECQAFICYHMKTVNVDAFKAINDSCLVYDGKLVINKKYQTNDPCIRAAGPMTKFSRRYHSENWTHANFNSKEIGCKLAETVLELFDPTLEVLVNASNDSLIPKYNDPVVDYCRLPGGYNYFHVKKAAQLTSFEAYHSQPDYGEDLVTGDNLIDDEQGLFRLYINQYKAIQDITCLSKKPIAVTNLQCLYGVHERYLNNLVQRFKEGLIKDFYSYFQEAWCLAIYHDRFKDFRGEVREIISTPDESGSVTLEERIRQMVIDDVSLRSEQKELLNDLFIANNCKTTIEERFNCFLDYNKYHLPMFARPAML